MSADALYLTASTHRGIRGLFPTFSSAAAVLRVSRDGGELDPSLVIAGPAAAAAAAAAADDDGASDGAARQSEGAAARSRDGKAALDAFFERLEEVESSPLGNDGTASSGHQPPPPPFVVVVEGLDGSGKSTLVRTVAKRLSYRPVSTPPASLSSIRPVFDKRGGLVARAFYAVGNYVLYHEMERECELAQKSLGFVVDRYWHTTCAYSVAWKNTDGPPRGSVDALPASTFAWPVDLRPPDLVLLLVVDDDVRRERVTSRNLTTNFNPWDERLGTVPHLASRIMAAYRRVHVVSSRPDPTGGGGDLEVVPIDANLNPAEVGEAAITAVSERSSRFFFHPLEEGGGAAFRSDPVGVFLSSARELNLCDARGRRTRRAPLAIQLAVNGVGGGASSVRTVGVHSIAEGAGGILFFARGCAGGGRGGALSDDSAAEGEEGGAPAAAAAAASSMICVLGPYPRERQFRAEGYAVPLTLEACRLLGRDPPDSLAAEMSACAEEEEEAAAAAAAAASGKEQLQNGRPTAAEERRTAPRDHPSLVAKHRRNPLHPDRLATVVRPFLFIPVRFEVLVGGPSSPLGPQRYEWTRTTPSGSGTSGWTDARRIAPYSIPGGVGCPLLRHRLDPVTLAVTGTHCSGKSRLGSALASVLGWRFDRELGDALRDREGLVADGHRTGDGSGVGGKDWDAFVHGEECKRDDAGGGSSCRVVETWHVGNLAWALQRGGGDRKSEEEREALERRAWGAVAEQAQESSVLVLHLEVSAETSARRRRLDGRNCDRLPMTDEASGCKRLHGALNDGVLECLRSKGGWVEKVGVPVLVLNNDNDGEEAMEEAMREVLRFVEQHHWKRMVNRSQTSS